ncbi:hypothetical protein F4677DRAFT_464904 [Hypoxylon crocopeplum]|nr:hypothetical protein F4677DRAFT_464904 [Hypoxylon crocopeplum]
MDYIIWAARGNLLPFRPRLRPPSWFERGAFVLQLLSVYTIPLSLISLSRSIVIQWVYKPKGDHLKRLMERSWFSRAWTFQECVLPPQLVLVCGTVHLSWDVFLRGMLLLSDNGEQVEDSGSTRKARPWLWHFKVRTLWTDHLRPSRMPWSIQISRAAFDLRMALDREVKNGGETGVKSYADFQALYAKIHYRVIPTGARWKFFAGCLAAAVQTGIVCEVGNPYGDIQRSDLPGLIIIGFLLSITWGIICAWILPENRTPNAINQRLGDWNHDKVVETMVHFLREGQATEPRDLVYALHGILTQLSIPQLSEPDFSKSQGETYRDLFCDLLRWKPAFLILLLDAGGGSRSRSPEMSNASTWVPNWAELPAASRISRKLFLETHREWLCVNATPGLAPFTIPSPRNGVLTVRSVLLSDVAFCTQTFHEISEEELTASHLHSNSGAFEPISQFIDWIRHAGGVNYITVEDLMYLVACSGSLYAEEHDKQRDYERWRANRGTKSIGLLNQVYRILHNMDLRDTSQEILEHEVNAAITKLAQTEGTLKHFVWFINLLSQGKLKLIVTSNGATGRVPAEAAVGDRLALVAGVPVPVVLRPQDLNQEYWYLIEYEVIGHAYVQGWMVGSVFKTQDVRNTMLV